MSLTKLREAVEAGDLDGVLTALKPLRIAARDKGDFFPSHDIEKAFSGSLDAAKCLHDALLPGWEWGRTEGNIFVKNPAKARWNVFWGGPNEIDARSFLLAILRALEQEGR